MTTYLDLKVGRRDTVHHKLGRLAGVVNGHETGTSDGEVLRVSGVDVHVRLLHGRVLQNSRDLHADPVRHLHLQTRFFFGFGA